MSRADASQQNPAKAAAGYAAARLITDGMAIGLGTGSTTAYALARIGHRIREESLSIVGVPTSFAAALLADQHGIPRTTLDAHPVLDLALDGADEVDPHLNLIKGRGAAHTREKVVAAQARRFVVLADPSKQVEQLGTRMPVPIEFLPMAHTPVARVIEALGGNPVLRMGQKKDGPVVTDQGFWILDATFDGIEDPERLNHVLCHTPGILDHGLFLNMAHTVYIGYPDGTVVEQTP